MPHLSLDIEARGGPLIEVFVGISDGAKAQLDAARQPVPALQVARALIDTGASGSVVDPSITSALGLSPVSFMGVHTPSTQGAAVQQPVYDVSIWLYHRPTKHVWQRSLPVCCAGLKVQGTDMLIGRDVLKECLLVYDGGAGRYALAF